MKPLLVLALLALFISACDFEPAKTAFTEIGQPSADEFVINLDNHPNDPIPLSQVTTFTYTLEAGGRSVLQTNVMVDNSSLGITVISNNSFRIDPTLLSTGSHTLKIEVFMPAGTGSLADKAGAEVVDLWLERTLVVDHNVSTDPNDIAITSVENKNGTIVISWKPYTKFNFQSYELVRVDYNDKGVAQSGYTGLPVFTDSTQVLAYDQGYFFGKSGYVLRVTADGKTVSSAEFLYEHPFKPNFHAEIDVDGNLKMEWNSMKTLELNFSQYKLHFYGYSGPAFIDKSDINDTTYTTNLPGFRFGDSETVIFTLANLWNSKEFTINYVTSGNPFPSYNPGYPIQYDVTTGKYYGVRYSTDGNYVKRVIRWDENGVPSDSTDNGYEQLALAQNSPVAIGTKDGKTTKIDLVTMNETDLSSMPPVDVYAISDNTRIIGYGTNDFGTEIFSETGQVLLPAVNEFEVFGISSNGLYAGLSDKIYKFNGTTYDAWTNYTGFQHKSLNFLDDEKTVIIGYPDKIIKMDAETKTVIQSTTNYFGRCNIDPVSGLLGCASTDTFFVINPDDLSLYKSLPIRFNGSANMFVLLNNAIVCPLFQVKLSDIP